jgi:mono/diheme cytochrome c family protein
MSAAKQPRSVSRAVAWTIIGLVALGAVLAYGIGAWSDADIAHYLSQGHATGHGAASGPMGEAVNESVSRLSSSDIQAMVTYLRTIPAVSSTSLAATRLTPASAERGEGAAMRGEQVYEGVCSGCHGWAGVGSVITTANLTGTRAVNDPTGINVAQIVLNGGEHYAGEPIPTMPSFDTIYADTDIAAVANYVTARFGAKGSRLNAPDIAKLRSQDRASDDFRPWFCKRTVRI